MITERYDVVVAGAGGMGSAALYHLARRGVRVCAVERFGIAHDRGSSHGDTRIIRKAYMEHPDYVPLLHRAYELWEELEAEGAGELFARVGLLVAGDPNAEAMQGQAACYQAHDLPHEELDADSDCRTLPQFGFSRGVEWLLRSPRRFSPSRGLRPPTCRVGPEARREALHWGGCAVVAARGRRSGSGD